MLFPASGECHHTPRLSFLDEFHDQIWQRKVSYAAALRFSKLKVRYSYKRFGNKFTGEFPTTLSQFDTWKRSSERAPLAPHYWAGIFLSRGR